MASSANCMNDYSKTSPANSSPSPSNKFTAQSQKDTSAPDSSRLGQRSDTDQQISSLENSPKTILITSPKPAKDYRPCTNHSSSSYKYEIKEEEAGSNTRKEDNPGLKDDVDAILARIMSSADLNRGARPKSIIPVAEEEPKWRDIGEYEVLRRTKCRRLYSRRGQSKDLALFYRSGKFYAMEAWCSHMGGPLFEGDIEDYKGSYHVMCPWHAYMFDLSTGRSDIGLRQQVYPVKCEDGHVFVEYTSPLALYPYL